MALMAEIYPLHILIASPAGWINRRQGEVLEYLIEESAGPVECTERLGGLLRFYRRAA